VLTKYLESVRRGNLVRLRTDLGTKLGTHFVTLKGAACCSGIKFRRSPEKGECQNLGQ